MSKISQQHVLLSCFVEDYHKSLVRSWTSLLNKPLFIKGANVKVLSVPQLIHQFQQDVGVFQVDFRGDINASLFWIFDFKQLLVLSSLMLLKLKPHLDRGAQDLTEEELESLQALARHGGLALQRQQKHIKGLDLEMTGSCLHVFEENQINELNEMVPEGLCSVFSSHFELFGHGSSSLITVMSDNFRVQLLQKIEEKQIFSKAQLEALQKPLARVLVADRVGAYRGLLVHMLKPLRIEVIEAETGKQAMGIMSKENIDLVFYDIQMADVDGYNFGSWLRRSSFTRHMSLVFCGAQISSDLLIKAKQSGMSDFLLRPPTEEKVKQILEKHLAEVAN